MWEVLEEIEDDPTMPALVSFGAVTYLGRESQRCCFVSGILVQEEITEAFAQS